MITISLDEYGEFEKEENRPVFIAGLIYNSRGFLQDNHQEDSKVDNAEEKTERERIRAYYRKAIADAGSSFRYPEDLHSNGDKERDKNVVRPVKQKIAETLPEFIMKGTYGGDILKNEDGRIIGNRKGKYHLFVMLKSDVGKEKLLSDNTSIFARDNYAANRYFHMAGSVVNRIIFHNPLFAGGSTPSIHVDIATRSTGNISEMAPGIAEEFKRQSYQSDKRKASDSEYYRIMDADIYRTLIAQEMISSRNVNIRIEKFHVRSIQYEQNKQSDSDAQCNLKKQYMEFLYLSDSICSILGFGLCGNGADSADSWLCQIVDRVEMLNGGSQNLIFGYDEIDNDFSKAWSDYENRNIFEALSASYEAGMKKGGFAEHYQTVWFPYLEQCIMSIISPEHFSKAVDHLSNMLLFNNLDQEKLLYLLSRFEQMVPLVEKKYRSADIRATALYKLYNAGMSAFCHMGDAKKALEYYEKCKKYAAYVGMDEYLRTSNKLVVCLEDSFEWDRAVQIAKDTVSNQELASEIKRQVLMDEHRSEWMEEVEDISQLEFMEEAKSISQLARVLAEKRNPEAEQKFREALSKLPPGSANYKITQSYLLHYYADMGMKEAYEEEATCYFDGKSTYPQRFRYIMKSEGNEYSVFSIKYALYVFIRGLYRFRRNMVNDSLWEELCKLPSKLEKRKENVLGGHPWEIIYKYLEMLAIDRKDDDARKQFSELKDSCMTYKGVLLEALDKFGDAEIAEFEGDLSECDRITEELAAFLKQQFDALREKDFSSDGRERYRELGQYFTFMYH